MRWSEVWILYRREMRAALRERTIVVNSILMPLLLYPFMMWAMFTGVSFVQGQTRGFVSRVVVRGVPPAHAALTRELEVDRSIELVQPAPEPAAAEAQVRAGDLDAILELIPAQDGGAALADNFRVELTYARSRERSDEAHRRLVQVLDSYRDRWLAREAAERGVAGPSWQRFVIDTKNVASGKEMGAFLLGLMLPLFFVIMVAVGCFYPAVDATAGERERNTWETLMSVAASRTSIVTSKYLYVASFGCIAGILNLVAMTASMKAVLAPLMGKEDAGLEFGVPLLAVPLLVLGAVLLAGFIAAGMMLFASFARTFKEGQAMITPFYMIILIPAMFLQVPGLEFSLALALVPVVNVAMLIREAVQGVFHPLPIVVTIVVGVLLVALCIRLATLVLRFEEVIIGSYGGSFGKFLKQRVLRGGGRRRTVEGV